MKLTKNCLVVSYCVGLLADGSSRKFVAQRYGTSEVNVSRCMKKYGLRKKG